MNPAGAIPLVLGLLLIYLGVSNRYPQFIGVLKGDPHWSPT